MRISELGEVDVNENYRTESLQHDSESLHSQQANLGDCCSEQKSRSSNTIPLQSMLADADTEVEPVSPSHEMRPSNPQELGEVDVNENYRTESQHDDSESLHSQQANLDDCCSEQKSRSSNTILLQSMLADADTELEPVSPSHEMRPSNPQELREADVNENYSTESLQHDSDSLYSQQANLDDCCSERKSRNSSTIPMKSMLPDADTEIEPVSPGHEIRPSNPQELGEADVNKNYSSESLQHDSESLHSQQANLGDCCSEQKSRSSNTILLQSMLADADTEIEPVSPSHEIRLSNPQELGEADVNKNYSTESLQHDSESLHLQQVILGDCCYERKSSSSSTIPLKSMVADADTEVEPASPNHEIRPLNRQDLVDVNKNYSTESLQRNSESHHSQQANPGDCCSDQKLRSSRKIPLKSMLADADEKVESVSPNHEIKPSSVQGHLWGSVTVFKKHVNEECAIFHMESTPTVMAIGSARTNNIIVRGSAPHEVLLEINRFGEILDMTHGELKLLARHLGHDVKTHKEYYQLSSSTMELSKVALMLYAVENGKIIEWKGKQMKDIVIEEMPLPNQEDDEPEDLGEVDVNENYWTESLQHDSESLHSQQANLDDCCSEQKLRSSNTIPLQSMLADADTEVEPVSPSHEMRPSNPQELGEVDVNENYRTESLQHDSESLLSQQANFDDCCSEQKSRSSNTIPLQSMLADADTEVEPVSPSHEMRPSNPQELGEVDVNENYRTESQQHDSESLYSPQANLDDCCSEQKSRSSNTIPLQSMLADADTELEPVSPSHEMRPSNPQELREADVNENYSTESLQHDSESLHSKQANLGDCCSERKAMSSSTIPLKSMLADADTEMESVNPCHEMRPSNCQVNGSRQLIYSDSSDQELSGSVDSFTLTVRRGVKRKWNKEEDDFFMSFFKDDITKKKMPTGVKILQAQKKLNNRSVAQIRTRVHNIMHEKQKVKKKT